MDQFDIALALIGTAVLSIGLVSNRIQKGLVQAPLIAVLVGVAAGPHALGWLDIARWGGENAFLEQAARLTLAIGLTGVALRVEAKSIRLLWRSVAIFLTLGMGAMWLISSALCGWLLGLSFWSALLAGAMVTPTDPVVANSIVTGDFAEKHLPLRVRDTMSFESGANDGLAYPFVLLALVMLQHAPGEAWRLWLIDGLLLGVLGAAAFGCAVGYAAAKLLILAERKDVIGNTSFLGYTIAVSLLTLGAAGLMGMDAIISVFVSALVFSLSTRRLTKLRDVQEAVGKLFTLPMFVIVGAVLPLSDWARLGWPLLALVVLVLLLRRPAAVAMVYFGVRRKLNVVDAAYLGWFGPIGIAAVYYASFARTRFDDPMIWPAVSAMICGSIAAHGLTAAPLTRLYARHAGEAPKAAANLEDETTNDRRSAGADAKDGGNQRREA